MDALYLGLLLGRERKSVVNAILETRTGNRGADALLEVLPGARDRLLGAVELELDAPGRNSFRRGETVELIVRRPSLLRHERAQLGLARLGKAQRAAKS